MATRKSIGKLSDDQVRTIIAHVEQIGRERATLLGEDFGEADFLDGVITVFEALGQRDAVPGVWQLYGATGRRYFGERSVPTPHEARDRYKRAYEVTRAALRRLVNSLGVTSETVEALGAARTVATSHPDDLDEDALPDNE